MSVATRHSDTTPTIAPIAAKMIASPASSKWEALSRHAWSVISPTSTDDAMRKVQARLAASFGRSGNRSRIQPTVASSSAIENPKTIG